MLYNIRSKRTQVVMALVAVLVLVLSACAPVAEAQPASSRSGG